ncbi:restriction endonuclease subunit S [Helicobacter pylori]|uniref:restriction endonuclease subunit S n=1 Tax=Helicobacter pylori TaxID=210 RepID=UPI000EAC6F84|nr:restriction endonuclease subunit S [Helicobacter pylori]
MDAFTTPLPKDWQKVRLGDICEIVKGQQINKISLNNTDKYPVINGGIDFLGYTNKFNVSKNTIAISEGGTCGYVRFMKSDFWSGGHNYSLQKISNKVNNLCLYHILKSYEKDIMKLGVGSGLKNIQLRALKDFEIPLPSLNEQIAIANILSDVDHYLYSLDALILKKESVKKALSFELLSQRKRLKGFNQAWQRVRLGDICEIVKGQQINKISLNNTDKYPVINGGIDFLGYINKFNVSKNTIAISEGGTCGYVRFMKSDFWSGGHNYSLQKISNKVNNLCLYHILKSYEKDIMKLGVGSGLKNIQLKALKDFEIPLPPLNEQAAIANILSDVDNEIISLKNKKRQFENIKKALNHDLMSAKIRVLKK